MSFSSSLVQYIRYWEAICILLLFGGYGIMKHVIQTDDLSFWNLKTLNRDQIQRKPSNQWLPWHWLMVAQWESISNSRISDNMKLWDWNSTNVNGIDRYEKIHDKLGDWEPISHSHRNEILVLRLNVILEYRLCQHGSEIQLLISMECV